MTPDSASEQSLLITNLLDKEKRELALAELSKVRESIPDLGRRLWDEPGMPHSLQ